MSTQTAMKITGEPRTVRYQTCVGRKKNREAKLKFLVFFGMYLYCISKSTTILISGSILSVLCGVCIVMKMGMKMRKKMGMEMGKKMGIEINKVYERKLIKQTLVLSPFKTCFC